MGGDVYLNQFDCGNNFTMYMYIKTLIDLNIQFLFVTKIKLSKYKIKTRFKFQMPDPYIISKY